MQVDLVEPSSKLLHTAKLMLDAQRSRKGGQGSQAPASTSELAAPLLADQFAYYNTGLQEHVMAKERCALSSHLVGEVLVQRRVYRLSNLVVE